MVGGIGVLPLPSGVVSLPFAVSASARILFTVQSPAFFPHLLVFAQSAAADLWLTAEVLGVCIQTKFFPGVASLPLPCSHFAVGIQV